MMLFGLNSDSIVYRSEVWFVGFWDGEVACGGVEGFPRGEDGLGGEVGVV